jgi:hypothetical protein
MGCSFETPHSRTSGLGEDHVVESPETGVRLGDLVVFGNDPITIHIPNGSRSSKCDRTAARAPSSCRGSLGDQYYEPVPISPEVLSVYSNVKKILTDVIIESYSTYSSTLGSSSSLYLFSISPRPTVHPSGRTNEGGLLRRPSW